MCSLKSQLLLTLCLGISLSACASGTELYARADKLQTSLQVVKAKGYVCNPKTLALAEANTEFAILELEQGDFFRASEHLETAEQATLILNDPRYCTDAPAQPEVAPPPVAVVPPPPAPKPKPKPQDRDGDGYLDKNDGCPDKPEDFDQFQDQDGCPDPDNDADGVLDTLDQCPNHAEDLDGFQDDDGCPDLDNDGDGILDALDKCKLQPEDFDGFQDDDGCPDLDNDGDNIPDTQDLCPLEPENYNGNKDDDGCPDKDPLAKIEGTTIKLNERVYFKSGRDTILSQSFPLLDEVATILKDHPTIYIRIEGHTDSVGSNRNNQRLSEKRAAAVKSYFIAQGISSSRMESVGFGEDRPIDSNKTKVGRANNRRVEIHITKQ